ncbi:tRNA-dihydrouridine(20/20a) synthase [Steroidobacter agaridevorans]|uniref:tRNA-dihydrouridine(20/20a) synthase n=1 Tax=Steroidobacter agaridevorans TaxID=2695856 RepID=A0A829YDH0_9GAMM|nr:tRNA dihydrouridine(20/20a) synthase DusA [Steroidobacter agaridevorans]GFE80712.1 tRNA-dihydrouridine(20/20a) synthase [Steroidobacter agaridevorans]
MNELDRRVSVAPMMDYTDRHCRYFLRLLSPNTLLYTEMLTSAALVRGDGARLLTYDNAEHPVALQLGGSDPKELAVAAKMGEDAGYDEVNLNCGCPSDRVQSGRFGACLMGEPSLVAECVSAMRSVVSVPVTVKCRIGIEPMPQAADEFEFLRKFIATVAAAGCEVFVVHARKAILKGLSPKENREIPPLKYDVAAALIAEFPNLTFVLNGGIRTVEEVQAHLQTFDGVMIGREAYSNPYLLAQLEQAVFDPGWDLPARELVIQQYAEYVRTRLSEGHRLRSMVKHVQGLYAGLPRVRSWRRYLSEGAGQPTAGAELLLDALRIVQAA